MEARAFEAIKRLADDKCVSLSITKFRPSNDACIFFSVRCKTGILYVCSPDFKVVEFGYKSEERSRMPQRDTTLEQTESTGVSDSQLDALQQQDGFVLPIMLDHIDHMHSHLLVVRTRVASETKVFG